MVVSLQKYYKMNKIAAATSVAKLVVTALLLVSFGLLSNAHENKNTVNNNNHGDVVKSRPDDTTTAAVTNNTVTKLYGVTSAAAATTDELTKERRGEYENFGPIPHPNLPRPISLWDRNEGKRNQNKISPDTTASLAFEDEIDFNPDDLGELQDKLVDETLKGVSSLITNDDSNDDFDSFTFPEPASTELIKTAADFEHVFKVPKSRKNKKHDNSIAMYTTPNTPIKYDYRHYSNFHLFINLYDHHLWDVNRISGNTSQACANEIKVYLNQLRQGNINALKASDSSGRYSGQFFFGNDFWLGTKMFCDEVNYQNTFAEKSKKLPKMSFYVAKILVVIEPYFVQVSVSFLYLFGLLQITLYSAHLTLNH